jgi:dipeptidyl aminopeptidase/acylaminoacyl peptidase
MLPAPSPAQLTKADYLRADSVMKWNELVYHEPAGINWIDSTATFWYRIRTPEGQEWIVADAAAKNKKPAFDTHRLVQQLNQQTGDSTTAKTLQLQELKIDAAANRIRFVYDKAYWTCALKTYALTKDSVVRQQPGRYWNDPVDETAGKPVGSPDSIWTAFIMNHNVHVRNTKEKKVYQLSYDGSPGDFYSSRIEWSPDSKKLIVNKIRPNEQRQIWFVESSPKDRLQPVLHKRNYLKPGDALPIKRPCLFDVGSRKQIPVNTKAFEDQYDLSNLKWTPDSKAFSFEYNRRGHQAYQVARVDAATGSLQIIIDEQSDTFIDYSGKHFRYDLEKTGEIVWASERDGWNHLYLIDATTGVVKNQITKGNWPVREVIRVDENSRTVLFKASGLNPDEDPYFIHCCKIGLDGNGFTDLTPEKADHQVFFSARYDYFANIYSTVSTPPVTVLKKAANGSEIMQLEKADITELEAKDWIAPEPFVAKGRDGKTDIWGNIYRPTSFDPDKKYPVIEYIYAGPHSSFVQKSFRAATPAFSGLAELGFIVVQIDGMGTSNRSKAFQDVCWKNLKDAGFPDRIRWMKAAADKYSWMDTTRVGLFGGSAGGQSTLAGLLFHPDFYKAGSASCGCHDNRMDKIWWNEQWMGYPIGPQYAACSNVVNASRLKGKLLLIVGEMDDNVDPASTLQVAEALIKAKKDFELVVLPGMNHTLGGDYGEQKRRDFFVKTLLGQTPPDWNN